MSGLTREATSKLVQDVDELMAWKKSFEMKQRDMIQWQAMVMERLQTLEDTLATTLTGCNVLIETDTVLGDRIDEESRRTDIVNKRLRRLEDAIKELRS